MESSVLSTILGNSVQVKLIEFFLVNEQGMYQLTEIAKILEISHSRVHDLIDSLVKKRIIFETRSKRNRLFELNIDHPITKQLKELYRVTRAYNIASQY
ncbi:MAG TPA: helix-turn-helix domain-containing protein [Candidatus Bathyarchaeia archaeon]|nr:helix-turn-helix domain-containing protein [Candidatus Bathyarchaeia archaeon]